MAAVIKLFLLVFLASIYGPRKVSSWIEQGFVPNLADVPDDCKKMGFCENMTHYPYDHVAELVANLGESRKLLRIDEVPVDIAQRMGNEEEEMCKLSKKIIIPQAAPDTDGKWFFILNTRTEPLQGFSVEICEQDKSPCNSIATIISGYEASCKQKYMLRYLTSIDEQTGKTVQRAFKFPTCCSCVLTMSNFL